MSELDGCCVPEEDMVIIRDLNMAAPYKGGNQYARICPDCGSRTFTTKKYWQSVDDPYVIPNGETTPVRLYGCPNPDCEDGTVFEGEDECDDCGTEIEWVDEEEDGDEKGGADDAETADEVTA